MFGYDAVRSQTVVLSDPGADGTFPIWKAPSRAAKVEILAASAWVDTAIAGVGTAITLTLLDRGAAGTATASAVASALGATGTGDWTANLPRAYRDGADRDARTNMALANTLAGYYMLCTSEHTMEHVMGNFHDNLVHGAGLIMISHA